MANRRGFILLIVAGVMGLGAAFLARQVGDRDDVRMVETPTVKVVVARSDVGTAARLVQTQLDTVDWPAELVPASALREVGDAAGRVARRPILAGEPVLEAALFERGAAGGLPAVISPDHRAVSVKVDSVIGVAGFVKPGARVDVIATLRRVDLRRALPYSNVVLQDVRVLAVDQQLEQARDGQAEPVNVVTLEVSPEQAQKLIYSAHEGKLQLALRMPGDDKVVKTRSVGVADLLSRRGKPVHRVAQAGEKVQVIRGSKVETQTF